MDRVSGLKAFIYPRNNINRAKIIGLELILVTYLHFPFLMPKIIRNKFKSLELHTIGSVRKLEPNIVAKAHGNNRAAKRPTHNKDGVDSLLFLLGNLHEYEY